MKNKWVVVGIIAAIVMVVGAVAFGVYAFAQGPFGARQALGPGWMMSQRGFGANGMMGGRGAGAMMGSRGIGPGGFGGFASQNSLVAIAAKDLNMNATDLIAQLQSGKSIADIAKEKNVSTDKIVDDFVAAHTAQLKTAVDAKYITQVEADAMLALMKAHATRQLTQTPNARGVGFGMMAPYGAQPFGQNYPMMRGGMMGPRGGWWR